MKSLKKLFENSFRRCFESDSSEPETVAYVAGSFKPPHAGHFAMVKAYAKQADRVVVIVGEPKKKVRTFANGKVLTANEAIKIWQMFVEDSDLQNVVDIEDARKIKNKVKFISAAEFSKKLGDIPKSPLVKALTMIQEEAEEFPDKKFRVILGLSDKDLSKDKQSADRFKFFFKALEEYDNVELLNPATTAVKASSLEVNGHVINATELREHPENMELLRRSMPSELTDEHFNEIYRILNPGKNNEK